MPPKVFDLSGKRIWVAGHRGMVGGAVLRRLSRETCELLTVDRRHLDLTRQADVERWVDREKPDAVVLCAARVGGIHANKSFPAEFLITNLLIGANVIGACHRAGVQRLVNLGSSCMYPLQAPQPVSEASLMTGLPEPTNEAYAVAKIAIAKLAASFAQQYQADFITAVPTNLYGPGDNFDPLMSHVAPALMRRMVEARDQGADQVVIWGTGNPRRELMYVDDAADAIVYVMERYRELQPVNIGTGVDVSIAELAHLTAKVVGYSGRLVFDASKPDGAPRRLLDSSKLEALGWRARTELADGLGGMYRWFCDHRTDKIA